MDPTTIGAGLAGASHVFNIVKGITGALRDAGKAEAIGQVIELQMLVIDLIEKNRQLADQSRELQAKLDLKGKMTFRKPFWFQEGDAQAHCPKCWEADLKAIHVEGPTLSNTEMFYWCCPHCKTDYYTNDEKP